MPPTDSPQHDTEIQRLTDELEMTADKLSDCWLFLDALARLQPGVDSLDIARRIAVTILRKQQAPGWKEQL